MATDSSASQSKHDVGKPLDWKSGNNLDKAASAVQVVKLAVLAHKNTRNG